VIPPTVEPFQVVPSLHPCYAAAVLRATLDLQPMTLAALYEETGLCQRRIIAELPNVALRGRDGRYYARKRSSFRMSAK
jgi:hypothetical protein